MKIYGQNVERPFVFAHDLIVDCTLPNLVHMSTHIGRVSFLTRQDVADLIEQLSEWLAIDQEEE